MTARFRVLHVCTGNICRSPMAERLMSMRLGQRAAGVAAGFEVTSAGTWGCHGSGMEEFAAQALVEQGGDPAGFVARELTEKILAEADLVLTATREHRSHVVGMRPQLVRWTFTLKEFARLAGEVGATGHRQGQSQAALVDPGERALAAVDVAGRLRGMGNRPDPASEDVVDPLGAPMETYRLRATEIDLACLRAVDLLVGSPH